MSDTSLSNLVVVGASAGGIEALSELVSTLPEDFPAPVVIAQHLDPNRASHLKEILSAHSTLPVRTVTEHEPLEAGVIFVVPADRHVNITDSQIDLSIDSAGRPKPSVDLLMSSAAEAFGEGLIAVVLTGTGSDGTDGARDVRKAGGTVIIQDPETAKFGSMPGSLARSLLHGEVVEAEEYKILRADGDEALLSVNSAPIRDERGEIVAGVVAFNDITARKRTEEALRKSEERYRALYEDNPFMYFATDSRGTVLSVNRSGAEQLGYTVEELVGRSVFDLFHEEDKEGVSRYFSACLQDLDRSSAWEARKVRKNGSTLWVKENVRIVQGPDDNTSVLLICEDITERKRAEEANAYLAAIVRSSGDAIIGTSPDGTIGSWNPTAERMFGYTAEEAVGRPISLLAAPDRYAEQREIISRLRSGGAVTLETVRVAKDGRAVNVILNAAPIMEAPGHMVGISATLTDISERKRAEEQRERLRARESVVRAEAAERRRISRELHDRVAHSMGVVHQSLQLYKALRPRDPSQAEVKLALAQEMAKTALDSTRNLAMELRNSTTEGDLEDALSSLLRDSVPPKVEAELSVEGDESSIPAHMREQLFLILREAVRNAVSHSGCGRISLHLDVVPEEITGTVEDDGSGFDPEGSANGGAGLKSMKERTALVGGACSVLSEPNTGTRVQVSIPLAQES